jgi:hypothetical protein
VAEDIALPYESSSRLLIFTESSERFAVLGFCFLSRINIPPVLQKLFSCFRTNRFNLEKTDLQIYFSVHN